MVLFLCIMFASFTDPMAGLICTARRLSEFVFYKVIRPNGGSRMVRNVRKGSENGA